MHVLQSKCVWLLYKEISKLKVQLWFAEWEDYVWRLIPRVDSNGFQLLDGTSLPTAQVRRDWNSETCIATSETDTKFDPNPLKDLVSQAANRFQATKSNRNSENQLPQLQFQTLRFGNAPIPEPPRSYKILAILHADSKTHSPI